MKLFYVTNGWQADLPISTLVIAPDEDRAIVLARPLFADLFEQRVNRSAISHRDSEVRLKELVSFHTLEATELCPDTAVEWALPALGEGLYG